VLSRRQGGNLAIYDYYDHNDHLWSACMDTDLWTVAEAKAKLSRVIDEAQKRGPQTITKNGRRAVVVVDAAEWERRTRPSGTLSDFFAASPLRGSGLKARRTKDRLRPIDL
jgi:prevent-host-death family protein